MKAIMFGAYYCGYCAVIWDQVMQPLVDEGYPIEYVDAMKKPRLAEKYHVKDLPNTVILYDDGSHQMTVYGRPTQEEMRRLLR